MELASAEVTGRGNNLHVKHGEDSGLIVRFYKNKIHDKLYVKINVPGDSKSEWDYPAREDDLRRFSKAYEVFQREENQFGGQTLLENWGFIGEAWVNQLRSLNVYTVEQLAGMQDGLIDRVGHGSRELHKKAIAYLAEKKEAQSAGLLKEELGQRDAQIAQMAASMKEMQEQIGAMAQAQSQPKRRGRKPKEKQHDSTQ